MEEKTPYKIQSFTPLQSCGIIEEDYVKVSLAELEREHSLLIARIHQLRRLLGYPPLLTGKEQRRQAVK